MRIIGWNIRAGGGKRIERVARAIAGWRADVVTLSEFRGTAPSLALADMLCTQGYTNQQSSADETDPARNALLVASRWPVELIGPPCTTTGPDEPCRWLPVRVAAPEPLLLAAMHVPNRVTKRKYPFLTAALQQADHWGADRAVLIGDTNSGVPDIDEESPAFNHVEGGWIGDLHNIGWRDAYRQHAGNRRAYTWYSPNGDNGFRLDQAFLSPSLAPHLRRATHRWAGGSRRSGVSDHAALIVDL